METILINPEFFGPGFFGSSTSGRCLEGKTLAMFRDSEGTLWVAFELADMNEVYVISTASRFFTNPRDQR